MRSPPYKCPYIQYNEKPNNYFDSTTYASIFFVYYGEKQERSLYDLEFPIRCKDLFRAARSRLKSYGYGDSVRPTRIEWHGTWQCRKKGVRKMVVKFN